MVYKIDHPRNQFVAAFEMNMKLITNSGSSDDRLRHSGISTIKLSGVHQDFNYERPSKTQAHVFDGRHIDSIGLATSHGLASHQFRPTYAYFVASNELGDIMYLKKHFE
jgi:hypothetical protein